MKLSNNEFVSLYSFLLDHAGTDLGKHAFNAWHTYKTNNFIDDYVVIIVEGYHAITRMYDAFEEGNVANLVQPFDHEKVYPLQMIKREIHFVYGGESNE